MSALTTSQGLRGMSWWMIFSFGCVCWNSRHVAHCLMYFSMSAFMLYQYTHPRASSFIFSMPIWFIWSWLSTCCLKLFGIIMHLPLSMMPSITASSSLYVQYGFNSVFISSLLSGHPAIIIFFNFWRWSTCDDACCSSVIDRHPCISVAVCMASTQTSMPFIGWSFPCVWLCLNSQSAIKNIRARFVYSLNPILVYF